MNFFVRNVVSTIIEFVSIMSLEEDILQERFNNEHQKSVINILYTGSWLYNINAGYLKKFGITPEQFNVMRILRGSFPKPMMRAEMMMAAPAADAVPVAAGESSYQVTVSLSYAIEQ